MIRIDNNRIAEIMGNIHDVEAEAYEQAEKHAEGSEQHGSWMRVAACMVQALAEFDE